MILLYILIYSFIIVYFIYLISNIVLDFIGFEEVIKNYKKEKQLKERE